MPNAELRFSSTGLTEFVRRDGLTVGLCDRGLKPAQVASMALLLSQATCCWPRTTRRSATILRRTSSASAARQSTTTGRPFSSQSDCD